MLRLSALDGGWALALAWEPLREPIMFQDISNCHRWRHGQALDPRMKAYSRVLYIAGFVEYFLMKACSVLALAWEVLPDLVCWRICRTVRDKGMLRLLDLSGALALALI